MNSLKKVVAARWFPTVTKPILAGALASGAAVGLHILGVTSVVPSQLNSITTAAAGLLVAAIVQKSTKPTVVAHAQLQATTVTHVDYKPGETLGHTIAQAFIDQLGQVIDNDPTLLNQLGAQALERVLHPAQPVVTPAPAQEVVATGNEASHTN